MSLAGWAPLRNLAERLLLVAELEVVDLLVEAAVLQQLVVRAALNDLAVAQHEDLVRLLHGAESLGDDEGRPAAHQVARAPPG